MHTQPEQPKMYIWVFDYNRREYFDEQGIKHNSPIYRHHWVKHEVLGETSRSWIIRHGKVPKKNPPAHMFAFSQDEVDDNVWVNDHAHKIADRVRRLSASDLKRVAEIVGFVE